LNNKKLNESRSVLVAISKIKLMGFDPHSHPVSEFELNDPEASKFIEHKRILY